MKDNNYKQLNPAVLWFVEKWLQSTEITQNWSIYYS